MDIIQENNISFSNNLGIFTIPAKQYDTGRIFKFNIIDLHNKIDLTDCNAYIRILKADGTQFQGNECTKILSRSSISIDTSIGNGNQILTTPGINRCELHITDQNNKSLTTWNFYINVEPSVHDGSQIISTNDWDILNHYAEKAELALNKANKAIADVNLVIADAENQMLLCNTAIENCTGAVQAAESAALRANHASAEAETINIETSGDSDTFLIKITNRNGDTTLSQNLIGDTPDFQIGTVTTGAEGSSAKVSITGTKKNPILNFEIPKGDTGSTEYLSASTLPYTTDENPQLTKDIIDSIIVKVDQLADTVGQANTLLESLF